jgi:exo-beta-1,3-glucanase (GH17 family)
VTGALTALRRVRLPQAGLGRRVALHVTETGFPTGPGRSDLDQVRVMTATVAAVAAASRRLRVTDFRWFDLRDADSASRHVEHQYGVVRSDFSRKPGFDVLQALVGRLGR